MRGTEELAHVFVKRVSGTVETENQGTAPGTLRVGSLGVGVPMAGDLRVRDPFALVLEGRPASKARVYGWAQEAIIGFNGDWTRHRDEGLLGGCIEQSGGGHVGG
jgi:hypothetical protein